MITRACFQESAWMKEKRYKCILCRQFASLTTMRKPSSNRNQLAVMISSHVLFGAVDLIHAKFSFETCVAVRKRICLAHFADAVSFFLLTSGFSTVRNHMLKLVCTTVVLSRTSENSCVSNFPVSFLLHILYYLSSFRSFT